MKAVILAAGIGSRFGDMTKDMPKAMLDINGKPIIGHQISKLLRFGITNITICVGHQKEKIIDYCRNEFKGAKLNFIENNNYLKTNNMYSLYLAKECFENQDFILLNGDALFDNRIIETAKENVGKALAFFDSGNFDAEELKLKITDGKTSEIMPKKSDMNNSDGATIGVFVFNRQASNALLKDMEKVIFDEKKQNEWFEYSLNRIFKTTEFIPTDVKGLKWIEIDDKQDLERSQSMFVDKPDIKLKVAIYGIGNFGYAILKHLDKYKSNEYEIFAYDTNLDVIKNMRSYSEHPFLHRGIKIQNKINFVDDPESLICDSDILILSVPSYATREVIENIRKNMNKKTIIVNTAKALDYQTGKRLSQIFSEQIVDKKYYYAFFAGGTIAKDLFGHEPLGIDIASDDENVRRMLKELFESDNLKVYTTPDMVGVEFAAAFKNVIAILAGIVNGLGFSYGSETHLISRSSYEIKQLVTKTLGGTEATFNMESQCWGNDLWMSCTGNTRNREFGVLLGKGNKSNQAIDIMKQQNKTVEGLNTLRALNKLIGDKPLEYPILTGIHEIVMENKEPLEVINRIMKTNS